MAWYFYALFAAIGITIVGVLQKKTLKQEHSLEYVALLNMAKLIVFLLLFSQVLDLRITSVQFVVLGISGFVGACALLFTARAMRAMELSSVLPILALDPAIVAVLAFFLLGEGLSINKIMGLGMTLVGTFVLEFHNANHEHLAELFRRPKHLLVPFRNFGRGPGGRSLLIAVSALAMGGILDRYLLVRVEVPTFMFYNYLFGSILYLLLLAGSGQRIGMPTFGKKSFVGLVLLTAAINVLANASQAKATSLAAVGLVIAVKRISVLLDIAIAGKLFHERHLLQKSIASVIILLGIYLIVLP